MTSMISLKKRVILTKMHFFTMAFSAPMAAAKASSSSSARAEGRSAGKANGRAGTTSKPAAIGAAIASVHNAPSMSPPGPVWLLFGIRSVQICPHQTSAIPSDRSNSLHLHTIRVIQVAGVFEKVLEELCSYNSSHCTFWVLGTTLRTSAPNCLNLCWNAGPTKTQINRWWSDNAHI